MKLMVFGLESVKAVGAHNSESQNSEKDEQVWCSIGWVWYIMVKLILFGILGLRILTTGSYADIGHWRELCQSLC